MDAEPSVIDAVLRHPPPAFTPAQACEIALQTFGIAADAARDLGSERDQAFLLTSAAGAGIAVLKISNPAEDLDMLDMEALAAHHVMRWDPGLTVAAPRPAPRAQSFRLLWRHESERHWVRAYDVLPGRARLDPLTLADPAVIAWGETTARLGRALRSFIHPRAIRRLPWDVQHAASARPMTASIADREARAAVMAVLDRYDEVVAPRWGLLRAQVVHGDLTADNVLADDEGLITGIVDFGDMTHTALAADLASVLDSLAAGRAADDMFRVARLVLDGYERVLPLEPAELDLMAELWAARAAVGIAIGCWRVEHGLEEPDFAVRFHPVTLAMIEALLTTGWARASRLLGALPGAAVAVPRPAKATPPSPPAAAISALAARRDSAFGPAMEPLSYDEPIEMASASGVWMTDTSGRRYLDMYNNVPCVGHAHPRVSSAVARQWRVLNTNMRYLHAATIELAERLIATCPPGLDTVLFVNSGSEANDLAWRLARSHTGNTGGLATECAYHGITAAVADLSPEILPGMVPPVHVETWAPPDTYRGLRTGPEGFAAAIGRLVARGIAPAAAIMDGVLMSDGIYDPGPGYGRELVRLTHEAGGLWIADEVQGGYGRTGEAMWSFQRFGIAPDFVTLGKPMGNGQPVGAVITRRDLVARFARDTVFFSTFGGNQVSVAAGHAVLDVLADERVLARVSEAGMVLRQAVGEATAGDGRVGDVRGVGLACGVELVTDRASREPDAATARALKEALRQRGVLAGTTGPFGNVLKVRPPLAFTADLVPVFVNALCGALADTSGVTA
jgi:4-aminobutyrate aminotransferase-like enzyme/Ser/Thr protein kinase RdoA (MazF antagonist)